MTNIKLEVGKTYRNNAGHLIYVKFQHSDDLFVCVRECRGQSAYEMFTKNGHPVQSSPVAKRFKICEEVTTGETVSNKDPRAFSPLDLTFSNTFVTMDRTAMVNHPSALQLALNHVEAMLAEAQTRMNSTMSSGKRLSEQNLTSIQKLSAMIDGLRDLYIHDLWAQGVSQKDIAERVNLSKGRISQIIKRMSPA